MLAALAGIGGILKGVFTTGITIPVWIIPAAWLYFHLAESDAVERAVQELVAGAEIRAVEAEKQALQDINDALTAREAELEKINLEYAQEQAREDVEKENLEDEIAELVLAGNSCTISDAAFSRLRNR